jgi:hypothetical protein
LCQTRFGHKTVNASPAEPFVAEKSRFMAAADGAAARDARPILTFPKGKGTKPEPPQK